MKDKALTMQKLLDAVGRIIKTKGYTGLGVNKIAKEAGVDKVLIYRYFKTPENLIETYVMEKDYWMVFSEKLRNHEAENAGDLKEIVTSLLINQFEFFHQEREMQHLILWEIAEQGELMKSIARVRESNAAELLLMADDHFKGSAINFRVCCALLSAGIYYMVLHDDVGEYCGINLKKKADREDVRQTLRHLVNLVFAERERQT
jgi:AcrR family transcriptional regulator